MTIEQELELWEQSKVRYERIKFILNNLVDGIGDGGSRELGIPSCIFCEIDIDECNGCPWGDKFKVCAADSSSEWRKMFNLIEGAYLQSEKTLDGINAETLRLRQCL